MTKAELIKSLEKAGDDVEVQVAIEHQSGEVSFHIIESVGCSDMREFSSLINITAE